ncbi:hypothetical protein BKA70DRAFT_1225784 [Coprinopsis sp. MPI-PUGE-AT-0042]|nr:hypothetical protein BKA70DRAFT_1225784 [Coprinopsis sp. MPI-PUGE-AT-0042]
MILGTCREVSVVLIQDEASWREVKDVIITVQAEVGADEICNLSSVATSQALSTALTLNRPPLVAEPSGSIAFNTGANREGRGASRARITASRTAYGLPHLQDERQGGGGDGYGPKLGMVWGEEDDKVVELEGLSQEYKPAIDGFDSGRLAGCTSAVMLVVEGRRAWPIWPDSAPWIHRASWGFEEPVGDFGISVTGKDERCRRIMAQSGSQEEERRLTGQAFNAMNRDAATEEVQIGQGLLKVDQIWSRRKYKRRTEERRWNKP